MLVPPNLIQLGQTSTYTQVFLYTALWNIGFVGIISFGLFLLMLILKHYYIQKKNQQFLTRQSLLTTNRDSQQSSQSIQSKANSQPTNPATQQQIQEIRKKRKPTSNFFTFVNFLTSFTFYLTLVCVSSLYLAAYSFGVLGRGTSRDILAAIIIFCIVALPTIIWKKQTKPSGQKICKKQMIFTIVLLIIWLGLCIFAVIALKGICICIFNNKYGKKVQGDWLFSTQFIRNMELQQVCPDNQVCHVYATLPQDSSSSVFLNVHSGPNLVNLTATLKTVSGIDDDMSGAVYEVNNMQIYEMNDIESIARRNVYTFLFKGLIADTMYEVSILNQQTNQIIKSVKYRTLPGRNADELRMAVGGDIGIDQQATSLTSNLIDFNPHVIIVGGDNAYDDGMRTCYYSWDSIYDLMDELNSKLGRIVPLVMTVGNHDVGYNALATVELDFNDTDNLPYYFSWNPQHTINETKIPKISDRLPYHYHIIGPTIHMHLDSGYVNNFSSQNKFIQDLTTKYTDLYKFANYHNPIYPSCTDSSDGSNDRLVIDQGLKNWAPLFDSGKFIAGFEHHTHHRKITKKIKNNTVNANDGVRYIGDGSWGVPEDACPEGHGPPRPQIFDDYEKEHPNHVWKVTLKKKVNSKYSIQYQAIAVNGSIITDITDQI